MADVTEGPATRYARAASAWHPIDWWKLEARALNDTPALRRALSFFAPAEAWRDLSKGLATPWGGLLTVSHIASFTLPAVAAFILAAWTFDRDDIAPVGLAGVLAAIAAVIGGIGLIQERLESLGTDPKIGRLLGFLHLVPSSIAAVIAVLAIAQGSAAFAVGIVGMVADVVVGALHFVFSRGPAETGTTRWRKNFARLERALGELDPDERARIHSDIQHALVVLGDRGLIGAEQFTRAGDVRIGLLGMTMAPRQDRP
ncbi:hypothetical protein K0817_000765 [Microbacterium sp. HD4P20]|uniref:hypothetical protein n=1 Tax=Microbacterium sp. HD4P20 TaxID=2864874 RepID=UPI001C63D548|nr:hypothetical protein [Microbacterium sp. HD4P20]MCP2635098.1 hypothetical protein [Microbacterium sp. HD4P20]